MSTRHGSRAVLDQLQGRCERARSWYGDGPAGQASEVPPLRVLAETRCLGCEDETLLLLSKAYDSYNIKSPAIVVQQLWF